MAAKRYELTDAQWDRIKDLIPRAKIGRPPKDDRMMLNAMLWLARSGAAWVDNTTYTELQLKSFLKILGSCNTQSIPAKNGFIRRKIPRRLSYFRFSDRPYETLP